MLLSLILALSVNGLGLAEELAEGNPAANLEGVELPADISREELYKPYAALGVVYDAETDRLYMGDEMVKLLYDPVNHLLYDVPEGSVCLMAFYEDGMLTGFVGMDEESVRKAASNPKGLNEITGSTPEELRADLEDMRAREREIVGGGQMTQEEFDDVTGAMEEYLLEMEGGE